MLGGAAGGQHAMQALAAVSPRIARNDIGVAVGPVLTMVIGQPNSASNALRYARQTS